MNGIRPTVAGRPIPGRLEAPPTGGIQPIGYQWTFVGALQKMRDTFRTEIQNNCLLFGIPQPEVFTEGYRLPEDIAEDYAEELAGPEQNS